MNAAELLDKSLYEARQHLAAGTVSPAELTSAALDRIYGDPDARACFLRLRPKEAVAQAASCKVDLSPVAGIPLAHKDLFAVQNDVVTFGTDRSLHRYCHEHADVLTALDQAGAVNLGGLHMAEFAMGASGWNEPWGFLTNPLDPERVSGGSSSGSATAVARRLVFGALGTDTGGSIRVPASFCGVVGFKPTNGLISTRGVFPVSPTLDTVGTLARNVRDCALLLDAICPRAGFADSLDDPPDSSVSFGVFRPEALPIPPDAKALAALERVAGVLRNAGYSLEDISSALLGEANTMSGFVFLSEAASVHLRHMRTQPKSIGPQVRNRLLLGLTYPAAVYIQALREREGFVARWKQLPRLMLCPSTPCLAPLRHIYPSMSVDEIIALNGRLGSYTASSNYLGIPALSVPVGLDDGRVIGIQIMGRPGEDALVLRAGRKLEALLKG